LTSRAPPGQDVDQLLTGGADLVSGIVSTVAGEQAGARTHQLLSGVADEVTQALRVGNSLNGGGRGWSSASGLTAAGVKDLLGGQADSVLQRLGSRVDAAGKAGAANAALLPARAEAGLGCASGEWCDRESSVRSILAGAVGARGPPAASTANTRASDTGNERTADSPYILTAYDGGTQRATQQANDQALNDRLAVVTGQRNLDTAKGQLAKGGITQAEYNKQVAAQKALQTKSDSSMAQLDPQNAQLIDYVITGQQQLGKDQTALTQRRKDLDAAWDKQRADLAAGKLDVAGLIGTVIDTGRYRQDLAEYSQRRDDVYAATDELRTARADLRTGRIDTAGYEERIRAEIGAVIAFQEKAGIDVLVHGEPERNDMVQYFAEQLAGYLATQHGWVQSYGTRYVRPPILAGDISRPEPMTVRWTSYAQSLTDRPVKGMLTGPVTMLAWSFVRDDQPLGDTARQVALALRDEVIDLEAAGTSVIQVDEPALRETLPLRAADRPAYLDWATESFRLTTSGVAPGTQIHTHMCYAEFGDIVQAIDDLDADVISLEAARSHMQVARELAGHGYPREAGPGVYDIHSPRVPGADEAAALLRKGLEAIPAERLWVNPDCGLKTRAWPETRASLANLVAAARLVRQELPASP